MAKPHRFAALAICLVLSGFFLAACEKNNPQMGGNSTESTDSNSIEPNVFISVICVGDMMLGSNYPGQYRMPPNNGRDLLDSVKHYLKGADITCGNLEGTFLDQGGDARTAKDSSYLYLFRMPRAYAQYLVAAGFDFLNTANNHSADMGSPGRSSTIQTLNLHGIKHAGYSVHPTDTMYIKGKRVGFAGFAPHRGCSDSKDLKHVKQVIGRLNESCDIIIVSIHAGAEGISQVKVPRTDEVYLEHNRGNIFEFARTAVDAGADLVFGHGPHVPRALELYKDRIISYSLGNFATYRFANTGALGFAPAMQVFLDTCGKFVSGRIAPFLQIRPGYPVPDRRNLVIPFLRERSEADFPESPLRISADGQLYKQINGH